MRYYLLVAAHLIYLCLAAVHCEDWTSRGEDNLLGIEVHHLDNSGSNYTEAKNFRCPKEAYLMNIRLTEWEYGYYDEITLTSPIVDFRIITLTDFNEEFPAGSNIYTLFREYPPGKNKKCQDTLEQGEPITSIHNDSYYANAGRFLKALLTYPAPGDYQFRVELEMEDGRIISANSAYITLY